MRKHAPVLIVALLIAAEPAYAQAVATHSATVDLTQIIVAIITGVFTIIVAVLGAVITAIINKYVKDRQAAEVINNAVKNGLGKIQQAGVDLASEEVRKYNPALPVPEALQPGVQYVLDHATTELKRFPEINAQQIADKFVSKIGLENIKTNRAMTASPATISVGDVQAPVLVPPLAPVPAVATAVVPPAAEPLQSGATPTS